MADDSRPQTRQELYDRIRTASMDEVIVEEMLRYGFWKTDDNVPSDPATEIARIGELERQLRALTTEQRRLVDVDAMRVEARKLRMKRARERREETQAKRKADRRAKARAWSERQQREIIYLGPGVSGTLGQREGTVGDGLPDVQDAGAIAKAMGIDVGELRFLTFHRKVSRTTHYRRFQIPKKTGGHRLISAPMPRLKQAQRWLLTEILQKVPLHDAAHGFVAGRSIVSNAAAHVGRQVVINLDLKNFFPTLTYPRVWGVFRAMGYSPEAATLLTLIGTEPDTEQVELDGRRWFVHRSERHLPQGSPASPALTNIVCRKLDRRLTGLAAKLGMTYTRYADDLTFSGDDLSAVHKVLNAVPRIVSDESFTVHPDKTRVMHRGRRQEVTGLVVNDGVGVPRDTLHRWRAVLFQVQRDGPVGKSFGPGNDVLASLIGFAAFVKMVDADRGTQMLAQARQVAASHGWTAPKRTVYAQAEVPSWVAKKAERAERRAEAIAEPQSNPELSGRAPSAAAGEAATGPDGASKPKWYEFWRWF